MRTPHTQHVVGPVFQLSQYQTSEGQTIIVRLSAPILTRDQTPAFTGTIQVDVTAEDGSAQFGKFYAPFPLRLNY